MNIIHNNIGESFERFEIYLDTADYIDLFKKEISFGKLLNIFAGLGKVISEDPNRLRHWLDDPLYADVKDICRKIYGGEES